MPYFNKVLLDPETDDVASEQIDTNTSETESLHNLKKTVQEQEDTIRQLQEQIRLLQQRVPEQPGTATSGAGSNTEELKLNRLYKYGETRLEKKDVEDTVSALAEPYKSQVREFINGGNITELQGYLNELVDDGTIDGSKFKEECESIGIGLDGENHISVDGKFGPQTLEAIKMLKKEGTQEQTPEGTQEQTQEQTLEETPEETPEETSVENDPLKGLVQGVDYSEETGNLIERYGKKFTITSDNQKEYIGVLNNIMGNPDKKGGLKSLLALKDGFWGSYKIDLNGLKTLEQKLDSADLDGTEDTFEIVDDEDEYVTIKGGKLVEIAENNESHHESVFEANGTSSRDDCRFDSVEAFMKFIGGEKVIKASEHVETLSAKAGGLTDLLEDEEFKDYKNRFSDDLLEKSAELAMTGDRYETFLSLLTLDDKFWGNYKLTVKDIQNFKRGMDKDIFDYRSGSSTVFHANGSKFEVDGTGTFSDETFGSVAEFFNWLENEL